jgi:hypothetical protein
VADSDASHPFSALLRERSANVDDLPLSAENPYLLGYWKVIRYGVVELTNQEE